MRKRILMYLLIVSTISVTHLPYNGIQKSCEESLLEDEIAKEPTGRYYIFFVGNSEARKKAFRDVMNKQNEMREDQMRQAFDSLAQKKEPITIKEFLE